jgi:hypothetical protein
MAAKPLTTPNHTWNNEILCQTTFWKRNQGNTNGHRFLLHDVSDVGIGGTVQSDGKAIGGQAGKKCFQVNEVCLPIWKADPRVVHIGKHHLQIVDHTVHHVMKCMCDLGDGNHHKAAKTHPFWEPCAKETTMVVLNNGQYRWILNV